MADRSSTTALLHAVCSRLAKGVRFTVNVFWMSLMLATSVQESKEVRVSSSEFRTTKSL